jgi:hypothetical protein
VKSFPEEIESIYISKDIKSGNSQNFALNSISSNLAGPIDNARRKPRSEKQKSLPLPFEMNGRRKTFLMRLNPISL